jgi:two-component system LytT family response regulator
MIPIRTLIVDDEPLARRRLRALLRDVRDIALVGECDDGDGAITTIRALRPDLVFLDVQMPAADGFAVLRALHDIALPAIVFTTAYDQYALRAFDVAAVDYLLKPFERERFALALKRVRERLAGGVDAAGRVSKQLATLLAQLPSTPPPQIALRSAGRLMLLEPDRIAWIVAAGNHVEVHGDGAPLRVYESLDELATRLAPLRFRRVHRSTVVNLAHVREIRPTSHGDAQVVLRDGRTVTMSRRYRDEVEAALVGSG